MDWNKFPKEKMKDFVVMAYPVPTNTSILEGEYVIYDVQVRKVE